MASTKSIVLITGANTGIGNHTAAALASAAPKTYHIIIGSRDLEKGTKALQDLQSNHPQASISLVQLDVTDQDSIQAAAAKIEQDHGRLDVLINNAGIVSKSTPLINELRDTFETNTFGPAVVTEAFTRLLVKSSNARLIYVTSALASITYKSDPTAPYHLLPALTYRMSKAALNMLTACHHVELGAKGVKVWAFDPGYVVTDLSRTGEKGRQERIENGAGDASVSARDLVRVVEGERE